jgi:hypothetical protein
MAVVWAIAWACLAAGPATAPTATAPAPSASPTATAPAGKTPTPSGQAWTFAAYADNRRVSERPKNTFEGVLREIRDMDINPAPKWPGADFVLGLGDINTSADKHRNWDIWLETFRFAAAKPCFFPVLGNWDAGDAAFNRQVILPAQKGVHGTDPENYYVDWKNVRVVVSGSKEVAERWIQSAPAGIEHVFVADHYPAFPRLGHEAGKTDGPTYWQMLLRHRDRVRAYLCGHTHNYYVMRVANPAGPAADGKSYPDEKGGIYQIDCGNAGRASHDDGSSTILQVLVDGQEVWFRSLQAPHGDPWRFRLVDQWKAGGPCPPPPGGGTVNPEQGTR